MKRHLLLLTCLAWLICPQAGKAQIVDLCTSGVMQLVTCGNTYAGTTAALTDDTPPAQCAMAGVTSPGGWYRFIGTGGNVTVSLCASSFDTRLTVYGPGGNCTTMVCAATNDDFGGACGTRSQVTFSSVSASNYRFFIEGNGPAANGAFSMTITCAAPPPPLCYSQTAVAYAADPYAGTALALTDDVHSGVLPIGFNFCFQGTTYTQAVVSSNTYISFNTALAGTFSPFTTVAIPSATPVGPQNGILDPWQDLNPAAGGSVFYTTSGTAPNRRFVVSYLNVPMFSCTSQIYNSQIVLYEGSNCLQSLLLNKPVCTTWNGGLAVQGLQNSVGSAAVAVLGRNNTQWTATSEGRYFAPTCAPCSTATTAACVFFSLPVELLRFDGRRHGVVNILEWATASEQETEFFIVERSENGEQFTPILQLDAAGNSGTTINYSASDPAPLRGINYYRLRTTDLDGAEELSDVIAVDNDESDDSMVIYPNPSQAGAQVLLTEDMLYPATLVVRDLAGRLVRTIEAEHPGQAIRIEGLVPGSYVLQAQGTGGGVRFVVE